MALKEILRTDEMGKVAVIESLLMAEKIIYLIADRNVEAFGGSGLQARVLIELDDFERAAEILIEAGFKSEIYPMKKSFSPW